MEFAEYVQKAEKIFHGYAATKLGIRKGQCYSNTLFMWKQKLYHKVPKELDPFYNDKKLPEFLIWLGENWK